MKSVDQQWQQLKENYEHMTEGELCVLAEQAYDLTDIAREALQAVLSEKGIAVRLGLDRPSPSSRSPHSEPPYEDLVIFHWEPSIKEAGRTIKILAAAGIPSFLSLEVREDDLQRAQVALQRALDEDCADDPTEEKEYAILCPKCHSAKVFLKRSTSTLEASPLGVKFQWNCDACGHQWVDNGIVQEVAGGQSWPGEEFPSPSEEWDPK